MKPLKPNVNPRNPLKSKDQTREILRKSKEKIIDRVKEKTDLAEKLRNTYKN